MTEQTKSFRIRNYEDELATVWQIGSGDFFAVKFDRDIEPGIYSKEDVANAFNKVHWEIVCEEPMKEENLPRTFKFKVSPEQSDNTVYTYDGEAEAYHEPKTDTWYHMKRDYMENAIVQGLYVVLPSEPNAKTIAAMVDTNVKRFSSVKELIEDLEAEEDILKRIKSATNNYDMTISIDGGCYHIYDNVCDISYKADTDEKLIEILDAIDFLCGCVDD